jgi:hypothetical protein
VWSWDDSWYCCALSVGEVAPVVSQWQRMTSMTRESKGINHSMIEIRSFAERLNINLFDLFIGFALS